MKKSSRLPEEPARVSDLRTPLWDKAVATYLQEISSASSESARSHRFGMLVHELLAFEPGFIESYVSGIEKHIKVAKKDRLLKGRADSLFGNVVIEFEKNIKATLAEALEQLQRYVAILWSQEPPEARTPYLCIAADGVRFLTYSPSAPTGVRELQPGQVRLDLIEDSDWRELTPAETYFWLDRYFLRKEVLHPTSEAVVRDFGIRSHAFHASGDTMLALWSSLKPHSKFEVIYSNWGKYLRIVYGGAVGGDELFIRHTYLATLAKLMSWTRVTEGATLPDEGTIRDIIEGRAFRQLAIENFIEEDFFSWLGRDEASKLGVGIVRWLFSLLRNYNLRELSEDVLKSLYQELVDPETRHDLGEFYTPDWLAHRIVRRLLDGKPESSLLDPACGSGTFLYLAVREKRERLPDTQETLTHIMGSVYGVDVHPLAVMVAKTNYILALGDLLQKRRGPVSLPVYLADSIKLPQKWARTANADYEVQIDGKTVYVPLELLKAPGLYDRCVELAKEYARTNRGKELAPDAFSKYLKAQKLDLSADPGALQALYDTAQTLKHFIEADRDSIWAFVLKNAYKPLFLQRQFDFVAGNPPWISYRYMDTGYQEFLKRQIVKEYRLLSGHGELITQMEIAALFLVRAAHLYLKSGGTIAFVLPRSLFSADQHDALRRRTYRFSEDPLEDSMDNLFYTEIWDCEGVEPLFKVPSCVLIAGKRETARMEYPVPGQVLGGRLERKNASLAEAEEVLEVQDVRFSLQERGKRSFWTTGRATKARAASYYRDKFYNGATIYPRSFWFVRVTPSPVLGINPQLPPLETDPRAIEEAKPPYQDVKMSGNVEARFIYSTLLSTDLLPFGHLGYRMVVLPVQRDAGRYRVLDSDEAAAEGYVHLAQWLERVQVEWVRHRAAKATKLSALDWLDYRHKLTSQVPLTGYRIIYNVSGTFPAAAVVTGPMPPVHAGGQSVNSNGFLTDYVTYSFESTDPMPPFYLAAVFNAPRTSHLVQPMQARGLWGARHICKKVLDLPIPQFEAGDKAHVRLAELGQECTGKVARWLAAGGPGEVKGIGRLRGMVRQMLGAELAEIDGLVKGILK